MASIPPKKAATGTTAGSARKLGANNSSTDSPSKSPTRAPVSNGTGTVSPAINRTRSVRTGGPPSARAAVRKPNGSTDAADEDAKAEQQAKLDELLEQVRTGEEERVKAQQKATQLQAKLDEVAKEQTVLEESVHEHLERINDLEHEKKESLRARRELEQIFESERAASLKEKEDQQEREDDLKATMQRLRETLAQKELRAGLDEDGRPGVQRNSSFRKSTTPSPNPDGVTHFAPTASLERSDSRSSSKLVMQKDKIIEELRLELAEAQIRVVEVENIGGGRLQQLEKEMYNIKMQNARLMEENDSFSLLLREKTLNGDFSHSEILRPSSKDSASPKVGGTLADELDATEDGDVKEVQRRHQAEVTSLKDTNKALTLYINNIISRLLEHGQFEQILDKTPDIFAGPNAASARYQQADKDKDLPPPPPEKDAVDDQPQGFLQRARSVMGGKRARPMSQIIDNPPNLENMPPSLHENPQTAPQIPLGRSGHRRSNSDWGAASSIVNSMYRGPTTSTIANPASPGLSSPTTRTTGFFTAAQPLTSNQRVPSGASVPTIPEGGDDDLSNSDAPDQRPQPPPRDSKPSESKDSVTSNPDATAGSDVLSNQSSPPRSQGSSNEQQRDVRLPGAPPAASSVMSGSRMRPLRLVQENVIHEDEAARKAANRGSWFGFLNKGA